jgi:hypothetical protein
MGAGVGSGVEPQATAETINRIDGRIKVSAINRFISNPPAAYLGHIKDV